MEEITERDFTQDYECITKSKSPYPKTSSPESLNSEYGVGGPIKSPKNSEKKLLCTRESRSPVLQSSFLVRFDIHMKATPPPPVSFFCFYIFLALDCPYKFVSVSEELSFPNITIELSPSHISFFSLLFGLISNKVVPNLP